jgi:hypothetical protein
MLRAVMTWPVFVLLLAVIARAGGEPLPTGRELRDGLRREL